MKDTFSNRLNQALYLRNMKPVELSEKTGLHKSRISQYTNGVYEAKQEALYLMANALDVNEAWLMGYDVPMERASNPNPDNVFKLDTQSFPILESVADGKAVFAEEEMQTFIAAGAGIKADFCLQMKDNSMMNARIMEGDIIFIKKTADIENGQIAAVLINNEATLRRVYRDGYGMMLLAENPSYQPETFKKDEMQHLIILGRAVAIQSSIV